jgi:hypothetical protein
VKIIRLITEGSIGFPVCRLECRPGEGIDVVPVLPKGEADSTKDSRRVQPVCVSHEALIAQQELRAPGSQPEALLFRTTDLEVGDPEVHGFCKRWRGRPLVLPEHARVLTLKLELEPGDGLRRQIDSQPSKQIGVVIAVTETAGCNSLQARAELSAKAKPGRQ